VTQATKGSTVTVTMRQINATGAGPFTCDMDFTSNADGVDGQTNLTVKEVTTSKRSKFSQKATTSGALTLELTMPADMACVGGMCLVLLFF
jgi:hypothetical protein